MTRPTHNRGSRQPFFQSLRVQVGIFLFLLAATAGAIFFFGWLPHYQRLHIAEQRRHVENHLATLTDALLPYLIQDQIGAVHETLDTILERQPAWRVLTLLDQRGQQIYPLFPGDPPEGSEIFEFDRKIQFRGQDYGQLSLHMDAAPLLAESRSRNYELAGIFFGVFLTAFVVIALFLEMIAGFPVRQLARASEGLAEGDYTARLPAPGKNEVGELTRRFGQMRETIRSKEASLIEAREEAEAANRAKSMFLANMSHELRTPLNSVLGFAQLMEADPDANGKQRERLELIRNGGEHLLDLLNDLLDLSKIEAGTTSLILAPFETRPLISGIEDMFRQRATAKAIGFTVSVAPDVPVKVVSDLRKIRQTLLNLVGNAIKFTDVGSVRLDASWHPDGLLEFAVRDSGPGIPPDLLEAIFNPFERGEQGDKNADGAGLGLAICKRFIDHMGGNLRVESKVGEGSTFTASIPVTSEMESLQVVRPAGTGDPATSYQIEGEPPRVLVVDDNDPSRTALVELLRDSGVEVASGTNGREAVELSHSWHPDLIFMDIQMPVMDGAEACEVIKGSGPDAPGILFLTASFYEKQDLGREDVSDGWLLKPFRFSEVIGALETKLGARFRRISPTGEAPLRDPDSDGCEVKVSSEALEALADACSRLEFSAIHVCLEEIQTADPAIYARFGELAADFRYEELEMAVREMIEESYQETQKT